MWVGSDPAGAAVLVNGQPSCEAPTRTGGEARCLTRCRAILRGTGPFRIELKLEGFKPAVLRYDTSRAARGAAGELSTVKLEMDLGAETTP